MWFTCNIGQETLVKVYVFIVECKSDRTKKDSVPCPALELISLTIRLPQLCNKEFGTESIEMWNLSKGFT